MYKSVNSNFDKIKKSYSNIFISNIEGIEGVVLDLIKDESLKLQSSISDYVLENNTTIQNHITLKPIQFTIIGIIAENVILKPKRLKGTNILQSKLNKLTGILPQPSIQAQQYLNSFNNTVEKIDEYSNKIGSAFDIINNLTKNLDTKQKQGFTKLFLYWRAKQLLNVKTPFIDLKNMVIEDLSINQDISLYQSNISITLKQITFAESIKKTKKDKRTSIQSSEVTNKSKTKGSSIALNSGLTLFKK